MKHPSETLQVSPPPLPRILTFVLAGGFANLLIDLRAEHVDVVHERSVAWLPIVYSGLMMFACGLASVRFDVLSRRLLQPLFGLGVLLGGAGVYFHNDGQLLRVVHTSIRAWIDPTMIHPEGPPPLAPLAFAGLSVIGILLTLDRFNVQPIHDTPPWLFTSATCGGRDDCLHCRRHQPVLSPARR